MNSALLVIDMINDFLLSGAPLEVLMGRDIIPTIKDRIDKAYSNQEGWHVFIVNDVHYEEDI